MFILYRQGNSTLHNMNILVLRATAVFGCSNEVFGLKLCVLFRCSVSSFNYVASYYGKINGLLIGKEEETEFTCPF